MNYKADLHVHSKHSTHPSEWFLQRLGASESYTEVDYIYATAKQRGMNLVTITDHNAISGALLLTQKHPDDTFIGVEATAYFPEDRCKVHILIYDFTEEEFEEIQKLRNNIYELRDFIKEHKLAYSVAHATYSVNNTINVDHLEKLILLFDTFEGYNGARNKRSNQSWIDALKTLTPQDIDRLYQKHRIEPFSQDPWYKNITGGSDDHAGLYIARTYTVINSQSKSAFLHALKNKKSSTEGRHNDYQSLALSFYKIAFDFIKSKTKKFKFTFLDIISSFIFDNPKPSLREFLIMQKLKSKNSKESKINKIISELLNELKEANSEQIDTKFSIVYQKAAQVTDEILKNVLASFAEKISQGELLSLLNNFSMLINGAFLCAPFISTMSHMHQSRELVPELLKNLHKNIMHPTRRILWFTDTYEDLSSIEFIKNINEYASIKNLDIKIVTALLPEEATHIPAYVLNLHPIYSMPLPYIESYKLRIPSVLKSLEEIHNYDPDLIYISTPGPIGLLARLAAHLLHIPEIGIYHTDYSELAGALINDISSTVIVKSYEKWFFNSMASIYTPTKTYLSILKNKGFEVQKLKILPHSIDPDIFAPQADSRKIFHRKYGIPEGSNILFRQSSSANNDINLIIDIYNTLSITHPLLNLIIIGDNPGIEIAKLPIRSEARIFWLGNVENTDLPVVYSAMDLLLFPNTNETLSQDVIKAQYCGLPVLIAHTSKFRELVTDRVTGFVVTTGNKTNWIKKINECLDMLLNQPQQYIKIRNTARQRAIIEYPYNQPADEVLNRSEIEKQKLEWAKTLLLNELPVII